MIKGATVQAQHDPAIDGIVHVRIGSSPALLSAICEQEVTLTVWDRSALPIDTLAGFENIGFSAKPTDVPAALSQAFEPPSRPWHAVIADDAAMLARLYATIMHVDRVSVRLDRIATDSCRRFHTDDVGVRLITTYLGRGTEWLDQSMSVAAASEGTRPPHRLAAGAVGLFKGRKLASDDAIMHRSPPIAGTGEERLLLVVDTPYGVES